MLAFNKKIIQIGWHDEKATRAKQQELRKVKCERMGFQEYCE
jgi:hypothetical protein